jgi:MFS family permease
LSTIGTIFLMGFVAPVYAAVQAVTPDGDRSMATAILIFLANVIGMGAGPVITGAISDFLHPFVGDNSLRDTLRIVVFTLPWAALHAWLAIKHMPHKKAAA